MVLDKLLFVFSLKRVWFSNPLVREETASIVVLRHGKGVAVSTGFPSGLPEEICAPFFIENMQGELNQKIKKLNEYKNSLTTHKFEKEIKLWQGKQKKKCRKCGRKEKKCLTLRDLFLVGA